jgi:hypothetical protein
MKLLPLILFLFTFGSIAKATLIYGTNVMINSGAENGTPSTDGVNGGTTIPGWTTGTGGVMVVIYGAPSGFPTLTDPGPDTRGRAMFTGGSGFANSSILQLLSVANQSTDIDLGIVQFSTEGYFGGFFNHNDNASLSISFLDTNGATLGSVTIGNVLATDRGNVTGLLLRSATGMIPIGTRTVSFDLNMTRTQGAFNDGYADNLSFVAAPVPEPSSYALIGAGLLMASMLRRKK